MSAHLKRPPSRMTVNEFLDWPEDPTGAQWQLVDGEPAMMTPASDVHNTIQNNLQFLLESHLRANRPGGRVVPSAGIRPHVRRDHNVRIPDLAVTCKPAHSQVHFTPDPVLMVEILSISNQAETWANVWSYTSIPTVVEILVVHSTAVAAEVLRRAPGGPWPERFEPVGEALELTSVGGSIGLSFPLVEAYRGTELADQPPVGA